jgi:D-erythrulose 4-kinase
VQVAPDVGELVTSLDMAGCSLSVTWLDEELEGYWLAPADTPAFRRGNVVVSERFTTRRTGAGHVAEKVTAEASEASIAAAVVARKAVDAIYAVVEENKDYLGRIDAIAGDGDHGIGMSRGSKAAAEAANEAEGGVETVLSAAGHAFGDKAGGTSGILWGLLLEGVGKELGNTEAVTAERLAGAVQWSAQHLKAFSKAELGDKTMLDALFPFVDTLVGQVDAGASISEAWRSAAEACRTAAKATASLVPKIGRARPLAERSVGTPDPGAVSLGLIVTAIGDVLGEGEPGASVAKESMDKEGQPT